jgi:hypothetical protein
MEIRNFNQSSVSEARWLARVTRELDTTPARLVELAAEKGAELEGAIAQLYSHGYAIRPVLKSSAPPSGQGGVLARVTAQRFLEQRRRDRSTPLRIDSVLPPIHEALSSRFPDAARLIELSPTLRALVRDAEESGVRFGGFASEGPESKFGDRPYADISTKTIFLPEVDLRSRTRFQSDDELVSFLVGEAPRGGPDPLLTLAGLIFEIENLRRYEAEHARIHEPVDGQPPDPSTVARRVIAYEMETRFCMARLWRMIRPELEAHEDVIRELGAAARPGPLQRLVLDAPGRLVEPLIASLGGSDEIRSLLEGLARRAQSFVPCDESLARYDATFGLPELEALEEGRLDLAEHLEALIAANKQSFETYAAQQDGRLELDRKLERRSA